MDTNFVLFEGVEHTIPPLATSATKGMVWHFRASDTPGASASLREVPFEGSIPVRIVLRQKIGGLMSYHVQRITRTSW